MAEHEWRAHVYRAVRASGRSFALTKATEGVGFIDPTFQGNWSEMIRVGIAISFGRAKW